MPERIVPLGEIVATHGIEGWLKFRPYNPETTALSAEREIYLEKGEAYSSHSLEAIRGHKGNLLLKFREINGINEAKASVGAILSVAEEALQPLSPGEYYYYQVLGLEVYDVEGERLGVISRIWSKPGGDLYMVTGTDKEYLIPVVKEVIERVDFSSGKIIINPPPGLLDL